MCGWVCTYTFILARTLLGFIVKSEKVVSYLYVIHTNTFIALFLFNTSTQLDRTISKEALFHFSPYFNTITTDVLTLNTQIAN